MRRQLEAARAALERAEATSREATAPCAAWPMRTRRWSAPRPSKPRARRRARSNGRAPLPERVREEARRSADQEIERARAELQSEAARLATSLAGEIVRQNVTAQDEDRLLAEFVERVGRTS